MVNYCKGKATCLDRVCNGECRQDLWECRFGGDENVHCAEHLENYENYGYSKPTISQPDCVDC